MKRKHILWIDDARTIAMLLVILGHCAYTNLMTPYGGMNYPMTSCPDDYSPIWKLLRMLTAFVFYFHVPLFMMLSGACFSLSIDKYKEFTSFVQVKAKRLLIPFFFTTLFLSVPLKYISGYYADSINVAKDIVLGQFLLMGNSHLWFVVSLFWIFLISYWSTVLGIIYRRGYIICLVGVSVVATYFYNRVGDFLGFLLTLKHLVYFSIGFKYILKIDKIKWGGANSLCKCCSLCLSFWNSVKACNLFWKQCIVNGYILPVFCSFGDLRLADYDPVFKASLPSRDYNRKKVLS